MMGQLKLGRFLLSALISTVGVLGQGFQTSTLAVLYRVSAQIAGGGTVSGTFEYTPTTYSNWNISVSDALTGFNGTYNKSTSFVQSSSSADFLILAFNGSKPDLTSPYKFILLDFVNALTGTLSDNTTLVQGDFPGVDAPTGSFLRASGNIGSGEFSAAVAINNAGSSVTAVPLESDALPIFIAGAFVGGGLWLKRKWAEKSVAAFQEKQETNS